MKKTLAVLLSLAMIVCACVALTVTSSAAEANATEVTVTKADGTAVTLNATNKEVAGTAGKITFDPASGTLTLDGVSGIANIATTAGSLNMVVNGTNTIVSTTGNAVDITSEDKTTLTVSGEGTLNITSGGDYALQVSGTEPTCVIKGKVNVSITAAKHGLRVGSSKTTTVSKLEILDQANFTAVTVASATADAPNDGTLLQVYAKAGLTAAMNLSTTGTVDLTGHTAGWNGVLRVGANGTISKISIKDTKLNVKNSAKTGSVVIAAWLPGDSTVGATCEILGNAELNIEGRATANTVERAYGLFFGGSKAVIGGNAKVNTVAAGPTTSTWGGSAIHFDAVGSLTLKDKAVVNATQEGNVFSAFDMQGAVDVTVQDTAQLNCVAERNALKAYHSNGHTDALNVTGGIVTLSAGENGVVVSTDNASVEVTATASGKAVAKILQGDSAATATEVKAVENASKYVQISVIDPSAPVTPVTPDNPGTSDLSLALIASVAALTAFAAAAVVIRKRIHE